MFSCPPRPEAVLQGLVLLQKKIASERPTRSILHLGEGAQGTQTPILVDGKTKSRDPRGPGMEGVAIRGSSAVPPGFFESRPDLMWSPPPAWIEISDRDKDLAEVLKARFGDTIGQLPKTSDMLTFKVKEGGIKKILRFLKTEALPRFQRLEDLTAIDESARRPGQNYPDYSLV